MGPELFVLRQGMENRAVASTGDSRYELDVVGPLKDVATEAGNDTAHETMRSREHALQVIAAGIAQLVVAKDSTTCTAV